MSHVANVTKGLLLQHLSLLGNSRAAPSPSVRAFFAAGIAERSGVCAVRLATRARRVQGR